MEKIEKSDRVTDTRGRRPAAPSEPASQAASRALELNPADYKSATFKKIAQEISDDFKEMHEEMVNKFDALNTRFEAIEARLVELENKPVHSMPAPEPEA